MNKILFALVLTSISFFFFNTFLHEKSESKLFDIMTAFMCILVAVALITMWIVLIVQLIGGTL
jgi:hypothetical protein